MAENDVVTEARAALARVSGQRWTLDRFTPLDAEFVAQSPRMVAELADALDAERAECERLRAENARLVGAIESAGSWIAGAKVAVEPGWAGSTNHILHTLSEAVNHDAD